MHGEVGLIRSAALLYSTVFADRDIQMLDTPGELEGFYQTDASIGVIRAGSILNNLYGATLGNGTSASMTTFQVDADNSGNDGIIDLIDVTGDLGQNALTGGPRIETGLGGNVRFIHVGGSVFQDPAFGLGGTINGPFGDGGVQYLPGQVVSVTDDSGAHLTITPSPASNATLANGTVVLNPAGQITLYSYGIYGGGGSAIVKLISTGSIAINSSGGNVNGGQTAEIGDIIDTGLGAPLTTTTIGGTPALNANGTPLLNANGTPIINGGVVLPANDATAVASSLNAITIAGNVLTDIFEVTATGPVNSLTDTTGGDIVNSNLTDVGNIFVRGNIGSTHSTTGAALNQAAVVSNAYPFQQQHVGIVAGNIVSISATGSIGNVIASGSIGTVTPDTGGAVAKGALVGISGPIVSGGNIGTVNIGQGIAASGNLGFSTAVSYGSGFSRAGVYANGAILNVLGHDADIRGEIIATGSSTLISNTTLTNSGGVGIQNISLSNGSLINAQVGVYSAIASAAYASGGRILPVTTSNGNITLPIQNISITGNGGIIGTTFEAADIGSITIASTGFGILNSGILTVLNGGVKTLSAGGYGIRGVAFDGQTINNLTATGNGVPVAPSAYSLRVRGSESGSVDPYTGLTVTADTDLDLFLSTAGFGDKDYRQGVIGESTFSGTSLGSVSAFSIVGIGAGNLAVTKTGDTFDFAQSIKSIKVLGNVLDIRIITGGIGTFTIGGDATGLDLEVAGTIGSMFIGGNFDNTSLILSKGASSVIQSLTVVGNFAGTLTSQGFVNTLILGSSGKKNSIGVGNFTGTIQLLGGSSAKNLVFAAGFNGDFEIGGGVGNISFLQGISSTGSLVVHGSLGSLTIGGDRTKNLGLAGRVTVQGNLGSLLGGGAFTGSLVTTGNLSKVKYAGTLGGSLTVDGSLGAYTLTGDVTGAVIANGSIGPIKIAGNIVSTGSFTSFAGGITSVTIAKGGTLDGRLTAGSIGKIITPAMGSNAKIVTGNLTSLTVLGNATGSLVEVSGDLGALVVGGTITSSVITAGSGINSIRVKGGLISSVIQSGITAGNDSLYGTGDASESQSLGFLGTVNIGSLVNSVVAAGGSIGTFISGGLVDSSVSSGLVLNGTALQQVVNGTNPLATAANVDTLRTNPTLLFGNIGAINIANGAEGGLDASSAISAGISPGADGIFEASDISNPPSAVGTSSILKLKLAADEDTQVFVHNP